MMRETHYVLEDGSTAHPAEVKPDAKGVLRHRDGKAVAMREGSDVPRSRGVDIDPAKRNMKPAESKGGYLTRESGAGQDGGAAKAADTSADLAALRAEYLKVCGKQPFHGWDVTALREKIAAQS